MLLSNGELDRVEQALEVMTVQQLEDALQIAGWAKWAGFPYADIGYPPCMIAQRKAGLPATISDDDAVRLDRAIAELDAKEHAVIKLLYLHGKPTVLAAKKLNTSRDIVRYRRLTALRQLHEKIYKR